MRITCRNMDEFLMNLKGVSVYRKSVHFDRTSKPMGDKHQKDATSFEVYLQASAVIEFEDGEGQALLQHGEYCGIDRHTGDGGLEGSDNQTELIQQLEEYCEKNDLVLRPGLIDM